MIRTVFMTRYKHDKGGSVLVFWAFLPPSAQPQRRARLRVSPLGRAILHLQTDTSSSGLLNALDPWFDRLSGIASALPGILISLRQLRSNVTAERATEIDERMAVVRGPACEDVGAVKGRGLIGAVSIDLPNGTPCIARLGLCVPADLMRCDGDVSNPTGAAIRACVCPVFCRPKQHRKA